MTKIIANLTHSFRVLLETIVYNVCKIAAFMTIFIIIATFLLLLMKSAEFFKLVPLSEFILSLNWAPPTDFTHRLAVTGYYGVAPLLVGTLLITLIAIFIAVPFGLLIAIYTAEYASKTKRRLIKPSIEILAGVPSIVYGFFALTVVIPLLYRIGRRIGLEISTESALGAGIVMGIMIIPFISSLSDEALNSVPRSLRESSWALGATSAETIIKVCIPAALPGIISSILLALSRAIGETMLVVMAAGLTANFTCNPLQPITTITAQIVTLLTGDQEFNSPNTLSTFALGLLLFMLTLILNIIALYISNRHREKYLL